MHFSISPKISYQPEKVVSVVIEKMFDSKRQKHMIVDGQYRCYPQNLAFAYCEFSLDTKILCEM